MGGGSSTDNLLMVDPVVETHNSSNSRIVACVTDPLNKEGVNERNEEDGVEVTEKNQGVIEESMEEVLAKRVFKLKGCRRTLTSPKWVWALGLNLILGWCLT